jgi:hypothetical protein
MLSLNVANLIPDGCDSNDNEHHESTNHAVPEVIAHRSGTAGVCITHSRV